jgi:hypothetical protein
VEANADHLTWHDLDRLGERDDEVRHVPVDRATLLLEDGKQVPGDEAKRIEDAGAEHEGLLVRSEVARVVIVVEERSV